MIQRHTAGDTKGLHSEQRSHRQVQWPGEMEKKTQYTTNANTYK